MIDTVVAQTLGQMPWPPSRSQVFTIGVAVAQAALAFELWRRARGGAVTLRPWMLRVGSALAGASALWALGQLRSASVAPAAPSLQGWR